MSFLIHWPGVTKAGAVCDALVSQIDIMATMAAMLKFDLPDDAAEDSHNLLPLFEGEVDSVRDTHVHNTFAGAYAIRHGDWLLVAAKTGYHSGRNAAWEAKRDYPPNDKQPFELYNLKEDIGQKNNLAGAHTRHARQTQVAAGEYPPAWRQRPAAGQVILLWRFRRAILSRVFRQFLLKHVANRSSGQVIYRDSRGKSPF